MIDKLSLNFLKYKLLSISGHLTLTFTPTQKKSYKTSTQTGKVKQATWTKQAHQHGQQEYMNFCQPSTFFYLSLRHWAML